MRRIENTLIGITLGAVPITACFVAGWWIAVLLLPESRVFIGALAGLASGVVVDLLFLRRWVRRARLIRPWIWMAVYVYYSIGVFGFFMGLPIFNALGGPAAGVLVGWGLGRRGTASAEVGRVARQAAVFATGVLACLCTISATIALASSSTAADLEGMLGLPFQVTPVMIIALILCGGVALLALEWWLTAKSVELAYRCGVAHARSPAG